MVKEKDGIRINFDEVEIKVNKALDLFYSLDSDLLTHRLSELAISHKFAEYLQILFTDYEVDL